jgi:hypothetical protein
MRNTIVKYGTPNILPALRETSEVLDLSVFDKGPKSPSRPSWSPISDYGDNLLPSAEPSPFILDDDDTTNQGDNSDAQMSWLLNAVWRSGNKVRNVKKEDASVGLFTPREATPSIADNGNVLPSIEHDGSDGETLEDQKNQKSTPQLKLIFRRQNKAPTRAKDIETEPEQPSKNDGTGKEVLRNTDDSPTPQPRARRTRSKASTPDSEQVVKKIKVGEDASTAEGVVTRSGDAAVNPQIEAIKQDSATGRPSVTVARRSGPRTRGDSRSASAITNLPKAARQATQNTGSGSRSGAVRGRGGVSKTTRLSQTAANSGSG